MKRTFRYNRELDAMVEVSPSDDTICDSAAVLGDLPGYESPVTGKWIDGRAERREDLKRSGCRPYDPGEKERAAQVRAAADAALDKSMERTIGRTLEKLTPRQHEQLVREITRIGADVQFTRRDRR